VVKSRYLIAGLQLHNIESLKLLKEKQKNEDILFAELTDLKEKYKKCLKVQDDLFIKYFKEKEIVRENIKKLELEKTQLLNERDRLEAELSILKDSYNSLNAKNDLEKKYKDYGQRLSKAEAALVK
jgi:predicted nuclease with TOPRIM domain